MQIGIKKKFDKINNEKAIILFFEELGVLISELNINVDDERLAINIRNDNRKRISVNINARLVLYIRDGDEIGLMINESDLEKILNIPKISDERFDGRGNKARLISFSYVVLNENKKLITQLWIGSCQEYIPSQRKSQYRSKHIPELFELAMNPELLDDYLNNPLNPLMGKFYDPNSFMRNVNYPLNQILFGPPGTGKTFNTVNKALEILGEKIDGRTRRGIKELFDAKMKDGQIVFTTFHQSMSYEDFIEGIKPSLSEEGEKNVQYEVKPGIFKQLCKRATSNRIVDFEDVYYKFLTDLLENTADEAIELITKTGKPFRIGPNSRGNLNLYTGKDFRKSGALTKEGILKELNGEKYYKWWLGYYDSIIDYLKEHYGLNLSTDNFVKENCVLILDEINRGNVSQIFGELITLIEDDKRMGSSEALEVTLPYSKEKFGVPPNLYIIGTMNTADRSVEALDTALRRRFQFIEMLPKPDLIATDGKLKDKNGILNGFDLPEILNIINKRIEKLLDRDHLIGHSFFMSVENMNDLKSAFQHKIIPLLQEYFFGDYGKIGLVLGKGFFHEAEKSSENIFADFDYDASEFAERTILKLKDVITMTDDAFRDAMANLVKK